MSKFDPDGIELDIVYNDPLKVSAGDEADLLFVNMDLSDFSSNQDSLTGKSLSVSEMKMIMIPRQM